ncbi:hypothetical protein GQ42DRAFT_160116, partial [Ramicandelaber brevisporus]
MSYLRLFDLPFDLLELLTLYFRNYEAVEILTISSNFHKIFARSVWHTITRETIDVAEPIRSSAYARYGNLVCSIRLIHKCHLQFDPHNWAQLFPNTTQLAFDIPHWMEDDVKQEFMDAVADLHGLRSLKINMDNSTPPFDLETLATVLVARHRDASKQSLRELTILFGIADEEEEEEGKSWADLSEFVQTLSPLHPAIKLQISLSKFYSLNAPAPAQMSILGPHLTGIPNLIVVENEGGCMALHNRQVFSPSGTCDDPLVFGRLHLLVIVVCCASPHLYNYSDFTQAKFPAMEYMCITENACRHQTEEGADSAIQSLALQKWPKVKDLNIRSRSLTLSNLDTLVELNPQLTDLAIKMHRNTVGTDDDVLMLERVAGQLPNLTTLSLRGVFSILIDSDWLKTACLVDIRSSKLTCVSINEIMLKPQLFEVLLALPNLISMSL